MVKASSNPSAKPRFTFGLVVLLTILTGCSFGGATKVDVERLDASGPPESHQIVGDDLWFWIYHSDTPDEFIRMDAQSGTIEHRIELPGQSPDAVSVHGEQLFIVTGIVDDVPETEGHDGIDARGEELNSVVAIDLESGEPLIQYPADISFPPWEKAFTDNGFFWIDRHARLLWLDLSSGVVEQLSDNVISAIYSTFDRLWIFTGNYFTVLDPETGETVIKERYSSEARAANLFKQQRLKFYDDKLRVSWENEQGVTALTIDTETYEVAELEATELRPFVALDHDGTRWECCDGERWATEKATWRRIDNETEELLGEYRFGEFDPIAEHGGYLWLRSEEGLGRVALRELEPS